MICKTLIIIILQTLEAPDWDLFLGDHLTFPDLTLPHLDEQLLQSSIFEEFIDDDVDYLQHSGGQSLYKYKL